MRRLLLCATVLLAASCTAFKDADDLTRATDAQIDAAQHSALRDRHPGTTRITEEPILGGRPFKRGKTSSLPDDIARKDVTFSFDRPVTLAEVCSQIIDFSQLACRVEDQVPEIGGFAGGVQGDTVVTAANAPAAFQQASLFGAGGAVGRQAQATPSFTGKLGDFLTYLANAYDTDATIRNGAIVFRSFALKKYYVPAQPASQVLTSQVSGATTGQGEGGAIGSNASQNSTSTMLLDPWSEVEATLAKLVPAPNHYAMNPSIRHVFVVARPSVLRATDQYFESLVGFLQTRIVVEATLLEVSATDTDDYGINLAPIFSAGQVTASFIGTAPTIAGTVGSGSVALLSPEKGGSSHFAGSSIAAKAISSDGRLSRVTHTNNLVQNGRPTEMVLTTAQDYVKNLGLTAIAQAGVATQQTQTETIDYGDTIQVTASMVGNDQIQLRFALNSTSLANLLDKAVGEGMSVQLKTLPRRLFEVDVPVESGETLVVSGQEQYVARKNRTGNIKPGWCLMGCEQNADVERVRLILLLTATRVPSRHELQRQ